MERPRLERLSIVTPVLNRRDFIAGAIDSVRSQSGHGLEIEHLVIDGGSTDGTLEVVQSYGGIRVLTGRDRGVYDALNKGIRAASGTVIGLLNSDDIFLPGTFAALERAFAASPSPRMVCLSGRLACERSRGQWTVTQEYPAPRYANLARPEIMDGPILTNSRFYRTEVLAGLPLFDPASRLIADRELLLDLLDRGERFEPIDHMALEYRAHGGSLTFTEDKRALLRGIWEKIELAERRLARPGLDAVARRDYRASHRHDVLMGLLLTLSLGAAGEAVRLIGRGLAEAPLWPIAILPEATRLVARRIGRALHGRASGHSNRAQGGPRGDHG